MTVVTGPSGSGKSSLVFDTLYAEGHGATSRPSAPTRASSSTAWTARRWTAVDGVPPAIAIDQTNPVRTSRSTVGTMTELNDHLKLLFARAGQLFDRQPRCRCGTTRPETIYADLVARAPSRGRPAPGGDLPRRTAGRHHGRPSSGKVAGRQRLHAGAGRERGGGRPPARPAQAGRGGRPLPPFSGTERARRWRPSRCARRSAAAGGCTCRRRRRS